MNSASGIHSFLAAMNGPATLCRQLRGHTRPIRSVPRSLRAIRSVESHFADELFGEQLLSVLGDKLRALLDLKDGILAASPEPSPVAFPPVSRESKSSEVLSDASAKSRAAESQSNAAVLHPTEKYVYGQAANKQSLTSWEQAVSSTKDNLTELDAPSRILAETRVSLDAPGIPARIKSAAVPLIVKMLQQYWNQELRKQNHSGSMDTPANQVQTASLNYTHAPTTNTDSEHARMLAPDQISDRMRAFVSGPFLRRPHSRSAAAFESDLPSNTDAKSREPVFAVQPRWASSRSDLEEKLVDILREQAIQHGIDIS
jgi:hypothetical protein